MTQHGFRVLSMPEHLNAADPRYRWRRVNVFDFSIEHHPNCPIDGTPLETIAALVSLTLGERIRIGCCPRCGIVGYIDRPSQADIDRYYAETWMGETVEQSRQRAIDYASREPNLSVLSTVSVDRSLPVLEIGCGYGATIRDLRAAGFSRIDATEHCPTRSEAVRQVFGVNVTAEIPDKRYGLIVSHHVLEHCADPAALIRQCAERQQTGDMQIHSLPSFQAEPSLGVLLFLPHLWSFSPITMHAMFAACGYGCRVVVGGSLMTTATRGGDVVPVEGSHLLVQHAIAKLMYGLCLARHPSMQFMLEWQSDIDGTVWKPAGYSQVAGNGRSVTRTMGPVSPVSEFVTTAPIEIQFPERVQAFIK